MTSLTCPKCASEMRSYERNRVLVDQCTGCGGLFLDRGELEKLSAAEQEWHGVREPAGVAAAGATRSGIQDAPLDDGRRPARPTGYDDRRSDRGYGSGYGSGYDGGYGPGYGGDRHEGYRSHHDSRRDHDYRRGKKKKSFLSELFDD